MKLENLVVADVPNQIYSLNNFFNGVQQFVSLVCNLEKLIDDFKSAIICVELQTNRTSKTTGNEK